MSSHRTQTAETRVVAGSLPSASLGRKSKPARPTAENHTTRFPQRTSLTSTTSSGRRSSGSIDSLNKAGQTRPLALPRSTNTSSQTGLSASSRTGFAATSEARPRQRLPPSKTNKLAPTMDTSTTFFSPDPDLNFAIQTQSTMDIDHDTLLGIELPSKRVYRAAADAVSGSMEESLPPRLIPELQALAASSNRSLAAPFSSSLSSISSPSTQFTTSPSPWSTSTTTTTPVSWSSASPGIIQQTTAQLSNKRSQTVPLPTATRTKLPRLPVLKENHSQSSSSSKVDLQEDSKSVRRKKKRSPLNSPAPQPPPRSSSSRSRSNSKTSNQDKHESEKLPPVPHSREDSISVKRSEQQSESISRKVGATKTNVGHSRLQEAINLPPAPPPRPSRDGAESIGLRSNRALNTNMLYPGTSKQLLDPAPINQPVHQRTTSRDHEKSKIEADKSPQKQSARSRLAKFSRLALFGRSRDTQPIADDNSSKPPRKGPVAGTGHEGYGRFSRRPRKSSFGSTGTSDSESSIKSFSLRHKRKDSGRSNRRESNSQSDLDEFASTRMKPVILVGGSQKGYPPSATGSHYPLQANNPSLDSLAYSTSQPVGIALTSQEGYTTPRTVSEVRPTLAQRRSQRFTDTDERFPFPDPIDTQNLVAPPAIDSQNTTYSSDVPTSAAYSEPGAGVQRVDPHLLEKQRKKSRKLRWNIFSKKDNVTEPPPMEPRFRSPQEPEMQVSVSAISASRQVPYYAMLGSESEIITTETIGQYLNEAAQSPKLREDIPVEEFEEIHSPVRRHADSMLLPSAPERNYYSSEIDESHLKAPPLLSTQAPDSPFDSEYDFPLPPVTRISPPAEQIAVNTSNEPKPRQPRLAQVGRIPKVIPRHQKADDCTRQPTQHLNSGNEQRRVADKAIRRELPSRPSLNPSSDEPRIEGFQTLPESVSVLDTTKPLLPGLNLPGPIGEEEFLQFSDPQSSEFTTSSSSDGIITIMGPSPVVRAPSRRMSSRLEHEDDVWNEYDDFIDHVMSPPRLQKSDRGLLETPSAHNEFLALRSRNKGKGKGLAIHPTSFNATSGLPTPPTLFSTSPLLQEMTSSEEIRLRRSRIAAALQSSHTSFDPSSPFSMREFIAEYSRDSGDRLSSSTAGLRSPTTYAIAEQPTDATDAKQYENAAHIDDVERTRNPLKHSELSYASLMVSRWLSFGRVLFSPGHSELEKTPERHVLVIDGLGNEDWSIYCAVTYQAEKAYVHDLKEKRSSQRGSQASRKSDNVPPNHRRAEVASFQDRFPFPPSFFSVVVLRFPPTMADSKLRNIVSECRRVLAPGGYLELMVLELDLVNMGVLTRRAVKDLKIKMSIADREVSLKPIIDNVQTVLGYRGFSNVSRCVVGVPVVGRPVSSTGSASSSRSSGGSFIRSSAGPRPFGALNLQEGFSLNDLVADHSENADAKIGRMVSRTARSWWQHCFEASVISDGNLAKSLFASKAVMNECKTRASNFRLLIAYSQKPDLEQRRRTLSEPIVPTLATAGLPRNPRPAK